MGFILVTNEGNIKFDNDQDLFKLGTIDEESYIVYKNDKLIIEENRDNISNFNIMAKHDCSIDYVTIKNICEDIKNLRDTLDRLISIRLNVFTDFRYANRHDEY